MSSVVGTLFGAFRSRNHGIDFDGQCHGRFDLSSLASAFQRIFPPPFLYSLVTPVMGETPHSTPRLRIVAAGFTPSRPNATLGHAQLSLVEHALCPLDASLSLGAPRIHESRYWYTDQNHHRKEARVRIACPDGLSPTDELYLWGLLSLTFSQPNPTHDFYATPYYCLRELGCITPGAAKYGRKQFDLFRASVSRLSTVSYRNDRFYDPVRREHRDVGFGFLSYSLPIDPQSSRAWRFAWDPIFFEVCSAAAGALRFDFETYRSLDPASRRLYLLLKKVFWRSTVSPEFNLRDLAVHTLGFAATVQVWDLKVKLVRCMNALLAHGIIRLPEGVAEPAALIGKRAKGEYSVRFHRGPHFDRAAPVASLSITESPLYEPLSTIGLDDAAIRRVVKTYDAKLVAEIADMTLAAKEKFGESFFKVSPAAYFIDNVKAQAGRTRTPPDWWRELRKEEERRKWKDERQERGEDAPFDQAFNTYLETEAREAFDRIMDRIFQDLRSGGQSDDDARENARHFARTHLVQRFRSEHPEWNH